MAAHLQIEKGSQAENLKYDCWKNNRDGINNNYIELAFEALDFVPNESGREREKCRKFDRQKNIREFRFSFDIDKVYPGDVLAHIDAIQIARKCETW